jgi:hypothetical protein
MGYRLPQRTALVIFDDDFKGAEARLRLDLPIGRVLEALAIMPTNGKPSPENVRALCEFLAEILIDWNLEDDDGVPVPADLNGVLDASADFISALCGAWVEQQTGVPAPFEGPSTSGSPSAEAEIPMEALSASPGS